MSKSLRRLLLLLLPLIDVDAMDDDDDSGDVIDSGDDDIRLSGQIGEDAKFGAYELSADDGSYGDIIGSWNENCDLILLLWKSSITINHATLHVDTLH